MHSPHPVFSLRRLAMTACLMMPAIACADLFDDGHPDLIPTSQFPAPVEPNSWRGILRINCDFSHAAYDDPLLFPGQPGAAHYHKFYGYTGTDAQLHAEALYAPVPEGATVSTCQGNQLNRSAYWIPALLAPLYDESGARVIDEDGEPAWQVVDAVVGGDDVAHEIFYYSAAVDELHTIVAPPPGLSIIAGTGSANSADPQDMAIARWHCQSWEATDAGNPDFRPYIPECTAPDRVRMDLFFPSCWNGVDLDSPDHKSHMAYPEQVGGLMVCPESHPVPLPRVSYHYAFPVRPENADPASRSSRGWRLASDMYTVSDNEPGGYSLHGDWINGWHVEVMDEIVRGCIQGALDCHDGNLANGYRLSGTSEGIQNRLPIENAGMGLHAGSEHAVIFGPELAGAWFEPATAGQGLFISSDAAGSTLFAGWFTYQGPSETSPGAHRWWTIQGDYADANSELTIYLTEGGDFDAATPTSTRPAGAATMAFEDCNSATLDYRFDTGEAGTIELLRLLPVADTACEYR
ncbi:DUF1996 domain-containing protein [Wenzhouxiangella marina]|uniref:Putative periplasmic or exported protein n=1 Tax=Wenzhouxiangella marina TaxID=1579979 RepID=A0A0K0XZC0_9GAMM|nr:DUF1996 domain-containing protein [Wenzhouxiangella marina]AKS43038.1 Putative periplasmic or exported protein [Wenzhouxiangella marina]MBB6087279.1 hypothetical protein [Wenzhouxiangella marina]